MLSYVSPIPAPTLTGDQVCVIFFFFSRSGLRLTRQRGGPLIGEGRVAELRSVSAEGFVPTSERAVLGFVSASISSGNVRQELCIE